MKSSRRDESGYALFVVLVLVALAFLGLETILDQGSTSIKTQYTTRERTRQFYHTEGGVSEALSWLRVNSQSLITPFTKTNFYDSFDRTAPSVGDNDTSTNPIQTSLKLRTTNNSAILTNGSGLGTAGFPTSYDITTGTTFDAVAEFSSTTLTKVRVRITLVDAIADDPALDYGSPHDGNPAPETDFFPIYRVDAYTPGSDKTHIFTTVVGDLIHLFDMGIYGQDYLEIRQPCDSYLSAVGPYSSGSKRARCPAGSNSTSQVHKNEEIYGSLRTNGSIVATPPYGGDTCADFTPGCPNKGETCAGEDCGVPLLESFSTWATYCPTDQGNYTLPSDETFTIVDSVPGDPEILAIDRCWDTVVVPASTTLTLESTNSPYFIKTLDLQNNSNSVISIVPDTSGGIVELYVETIIGNKLNGNQTLNPLPNTPIQFQLYYLGTNDLTLDGNADMQAALVAPNAAVTVSGNFDYHGALLASELTLSGSGGIHYDESLGGSGRVSDTQYQLLEMIQKYR